MIHGQSLGGANKPNKVSILTQFYPPDYAATGQLIEELAIELGKLGLPIHIFTGQPSYAFYKESAPAIESVNRVTIQRSRATRIWSKRIRGKALNGLLFCLRSGLHLLKTRNRGTLLLITTAPPFLPILGYLANKIFGLPYLCLLYDLYPDIAIELKVVSRHHWLVRLWQALNRKIWQNAQQLIVLSPSMKEQIISHYPEIRDKITVIHNWANPNWIVPMAKSDNWFAQSFNLVDAFTVLYSGNMGRCHDMDTILEAAKLLEDEPIQFIFIGNGAKRNALQSQIHQLGLNNCRFLPYQEKQNLPYSLTACDLSLVSVSSGMKGLVAPSKFYAALAAGRPIAAICEPQSYLRDMLAEAGCGAAFDNGDAVSLAHFIRHLSTDTQLARQMGNAARQYLQSHFTPERIAREYSKLLGQSIVEEYESSTPKTVPVVPSRPQSPFRK